MPAGTITLNKRFIHALYRQVASLAPHGRDSLNCELDSHADTCALGKGFVMIETPQRTVNVYPYSEEYKPIKDIPIATVATTWVDQRNGQPYLLVFNEALFFGSRLTHSLICPNQLRANGLRVHDTPTQFDHTSSHSIHIPEKDVTIPLTMKGVISCFETHKPSEQELEELPRLIMTSPTPWKPTSPIFAEEEEAQRSICSTLIIRKDGRSSLNAERILSAVATYQTVVSDDLVLVDEEDNLYNRLISKVRVSIADKEDLETLSPEEKGGPVCASIQTSNPKTWLTPQLLSKRWNIGLEKANNTLNVTTQAGIRNVLIPSERKVRKKAPWLKFPAIKGRWFTDQMFAAVPSLNGERIASVFTNGKGYDLVYPIRTKGEHSIAFMKMIHDLGVPQTVVSDGAKELMLGRAKEIANEYRVETKATVPYSHWQNQAEGSIREIKKGTRRKLRQTGAPLRTWSYCAKWVTAIRRFTASDIPELDGRTPYEYVVGSTPDISPLALFDFWELVYVLMPVPAYPHEKKVIGRWLGLADNCTDDMAYVVVTETGIPIVRKDIWAISEDDQKDPIIMKRIKEVDEAIRTKLAGTLGNKDGLSDPPPSLFDDEPEEEISLIEPERQAVEADDYTPEELDEYLTTEVVLPHGGESARATVIGRVKDKDGRPVGQRHDNPILDTRMYDVQYPDGSQEAVTANLIAENLYSQVDEEGRTHLILKEITGHRKDHKAVAEDDKEYVSGKKRITTKGWKLECAWSDGTTSWVPLKDIKESNPVEAAEYAMASGIAGEPAFDWWARHTLRKRDRILKKVKSRYWKRTHKYGVELPKAVAEALAIDKRTGTTFWRDAIEKEMKNVSCAFQFQDNDKVPIGYKHIDCHMIFDIKSDLTRKARFVAGGHQTDPPKESVYSSVVSRDSIRIAFTVAALNGLDILAADVQNAYLNAPTKEKVYTTAGLEFGPDNVGRPVLIVRALYGLKSSGARWRDHMASTLREAGFKGCLADPDVWLRSNVKPDGHKYWEYVLCYVDDILAISHDPQGIMDYLSGRYTLKAGSVKPPTEYLGSEVRQHDIPGKEKPRWAMSSDLYVKRAIAEVERELQNMDQKLKTKVSTPFAHGYRPEVDVTPELDPKRANYYQGLIGVLRWIVELGRIDIVLPVSLLSRHMVLPREGHLEQALHVFAYLKRYNRSCIVFDDTAPTYDESRFTTSDWTQYYPDAAEPLPINMPEPRGHAVDMSCFVDADHAGCRVTRRSQTGVIIFLQSAPILWYSKRQNTVESSTFGSEFIAMKTAVEQIEGMRYKLRMMGIPLDGPTSVFCDNESVFKNSTAPESTLKKKHNSIAYHRTREAQAAKTVQIAWEKGETNLADLLTKILPGPRIRFLGQRIMW